MLRALVVLALFPLAATAAEPLLLPPGRSITVVDGRDAAIRVVLTAPANEPLDIAPLLEAADGNVRALATIRQAKPAAGLTRNADGSLSLGAAPAPREGRIVEKGLVVVRRGGYEIRDEAPEAQRAPADPIVEYTFGRDRVGLPAQVDSLRMRVPPALVPNLPKEMRKAD